MATVLKAAQNDREVSEHHTSDSGNCARRSALLAPGTWPALKQAVAMLRPDIQWKNAVFVVEIGAF